MTRDEIGHLVVRSIRADHTPWMDAARRMPVALQTNNDFADPAKETVFGALLGRLWELIDRYRSRESHTTLSMNMVDAHEVLLVHALCTVPEFPGEDLDLKPDWGSSDKLDVENRAWAFSGLCSTEYGVEPLNDWDRFVKNAVETLESCGSSLLVSSQSNSSRDPHQSKKPKDSVQRKRRSNRTPEEIKHDELAIAAFLVDHPCATRDQIAAGTGISAGNVSNSFTWRSRRESLKSARNANRARGVGGSDGPDLDDLPGQDLAD